MRRRKFIELRLPAVYAFGYLVAEGGLMSYGADRIDEMRQAASSIGRILRGDKPADLPAQAPTKFATVVNLKTAKALGVTIPPACFWPPTRFASQILHNACEPSRVMAIRPQGNIALEPD